MKWHQEAGVLPGHPDTQGILVLTFNFDAGVDECGQAYASRSIQAFLPDNLVGGHVLALFQVAFKRRLLFSLGTSLTTGKRWPTFNVHMKTNRSGGIAEHGYPDATYLDRALKELSGHGIEISSLDSVTHKTALLQACVTSDISSRNPRVKQAALAQEAFSGKEKTADAKDAVRPVISLADRLFPDDEAGEPPAKNYADVPRRPVACVQKNMCLMCGSFVPQDQYNSHAHMHALCKDVPCPAHVGAADCSTAAGTESKCTSSSSSDNWLETLSSLNLVPCDHCDCMIAFEGYVEHMALVHGLAICKCALCNAEFTAAEQTELCSSCLQLTQSTPMVDTHCTPESLSMQLVEMVRCAAEDLPTIEIMEVCNFDLAVGFVREFLFHFAAGHEKIEVVYHWTREANINTIIDNNLRVPGDVNSDGSRIQTANGERYGRGIYAATDLNYGRHYGRGARGAFLCLALPGVFRHGRRRVDQLLSTGKLPDSICDGPLRVYRSSAQLLPLFVTDEKHEEQLRAAAFRVSKFLQCQVNKVNTTGSRVRPPSMLGGA